MHRKMLGIAALSLALLGTISCNGRLDMNKRTEGEYSLWLAPSGAEYEALSTLVCKLAQQYPSHCFVPHATVVGGVKGSLNEVAVKAAELASRTGALEARLTTIEWATPDEYYRAFYLVIEETGAFSKLYDDTCEIIGKCHKRPYHISIMYTDKLSDAERVVIRDSIYATRGKSEFGETVTLNRLQVCVTTDLPPEKWICPIEIKLN